MPVINNNHHDPPWYLPGGQLQTIYPYFLRKVSVNYHRERWELPDGDFLDLDWLFHKSKRLVIICHGLEGSSQSKYAAGMARYFHERALNVLCLNFRSCSGEMNRLLPMYHHGQTEDLQYVVERITNDYNFEQLHLIGFSLGGNVVLKYLGIADSLPEQVKTGIGISVPSDLSSSSIGLDQWYNLHYTRRFRRNLKKKFMIKDQMFPGVLQMEKWSDKMSWWDFDNTFTCKLWGFKDADEYYTQGSGNNFLPDIKIPALLIQAQNDPFLQAPSYPVELCKKLTKVHLLTPRFGGHVGFMEKKNNYWSEVMALKFILEKGF